MKRYFAALYLTAFVSATIGAEEADPCAGLAGSVLAQCQNNQQKIQRQQLAQQQQQLAQQQQQLMRQQQQMEQSPPNERPQNQRQLEDMQHRIDALSTQVEHQKSANQPVTPAAKEAKRREVEDWRANNPWYGSDYPRTQFAMRYAKELQQEQPDLAGRPFLDAISAKVTDKFGTSK